MFRPKPINSPATSSFVPWKKKIRILAPVVGLALLGAAGCATPPEDDPEALAEWHEINDPIEPTNRAIFAFNLGLDRMVFRPLAEGYRWLFPDFLREAIQNVLANIDEPVNFFNAALQGNAERAATVIGRIAINSTVGVGGMFDVASSEFGLEPVDEDFGQTLAVWGTNSGAYVMLPVFGPSSVRDGIGRGVDQFLDPLSYLYANTDTEYIGVGLFVVQGIDQRSRNLDILDEIERTSVDFYAAIRSLYRQRRTDLINNGEPEIDVDPFFSYSPLFLDDSELSNVE